MNKKLSSEDMAFGIFRENKFDTKYNILFQGFRRPGPYKEWISMDLEAQKDPRNQTNSNILN